MASIGKADGFRHLQDKILTSPTQNVTSPTSACFVIFVKMVTPKHK